MCRIVIVVEDLASARKVDVIDRVRAVTGLGMTAIAERIRGSKPLVVETLFSRSHDEVAGRLRALVTELPSMGAKLRLFEVWGDELTTDAPDSRREITIEVLLNILKSHDDELRRQQELWDEHGHA